MASGPSLEWEHDERVVIDGTSYVLMNEERAGDEMRIFKPRIMLQDYDPLIEEFQGANILELGLLEGGSAAYLLQRCEPRRFVGVDREPDRCERLDRFVAAGGRADQVVLHHGVDQSDQERVREIAVEGFGGQAIDLVIDDASHLYHPTVASFEVLFPMVRPGGLYLIEDWTSDDWLAVTWVDLLAHREPMARALAEQWLAKIVSNGSNVAGRCFERWVVTALTDPSVPHHGSTVEWFETLRRRGATADSVTLDERVRHRLEVGTGDLEGPTLGTLGLQLLLAVKGLCSAFASVTVTPWWIAVRRGGDIPTPFTVAAVSDDRLDVVGDLARLTGPSR